MRSSLALLFCSAGVCIAAPALARSPVPVVAAPVAHGSSWASELVELAELVKPTDTTCTDHCWVLDHMRFSGALGQGKVDFTLEGSVLQKGTYQIPLFGPADKVRLEGVTENGGHATIGFEEGHYYLHTSSPHFTLRGKLVLPEDRTVTIVGPLNSLDSDVTGGRITEGAHMTALAASALHFDAEGDAPPPQPPVFTIARALRVGKSIDFEYKLTAQASADLGVVHLPLRYGERVVDVAGSTGWRIESEELLLPTTGKVADITITGTLSNVSSFQPDPRAPFEWWLLESDAEHRVLAAGDAKQHDINESPLLRREPNSRLYLVQRGQHLDVTLQTLQSLDVLAATIRSHSRQVILTSSGDLVMQDMLTYDNSGLDYLYYTPDGKPLFLSTDGASERVMHKDGSDDLMVPMRMGQHSIVVQSLSQTSIGSLMGRITVPGPRVPLATGSEMLTFGLPASVHPIVVTGGDQTQWPVSMNDGIALALAGLASMLALRGWKKRSLGTVTMFGLWFVAKPAFAVVLGVGVVALLFPLFARLGKTTRRVTLALGVLGAVIVGVPTLVMSSKARGIDETTAMVAASDGVVDTRVSLEMSANDKSNIAQRVNLPMQGAQAQAIGGNVNFAAQLAHGGLVDGVRPVALTLPTYEHAAYASRQLVTPARAFTPVVYYITDSGIALLALAWLSCAAALAWSQRDKLRALRDRIRALLAPKPVDVVATAAPTPAE